MKEHNNKERGVKISTIFVEEKLLFIAEKFVRRRKPLVRNDTLSYFD